MSGSVEAGKAVDRAAMLAELRGIGQQYGLPQGTQVIDVVRYLHAQCQCLTETNRVLTAQQVQPLALPVAAAAAAAAETAEVPAPAAAAAETAEVPAAAAAAAETAEVPAAAAETAEVPLTRKQLMVRGAIFVAGIGIAILIAKNEDAIKAAASTAASRLSTGVVAGASRLQTAASAGASRMKTAASAGASRLQTAASAGASRVSNDFSRFRSGVQNMVHSLYAGHYSNRAAELVQGGVVGGAVLPTAFVPVQDAPIAPVVDDVVGHTLAGEPVTAETVVDAPVLDVGVSKETAQVEAEVDGLAAAATTLVQGEEVKS